MYCAHCGQDNSETRSACAACGAPAHDAGAPGGFWIRTLAALLDLVFTLMLGLLLIGPLSLAADALLGGADPSEAERAGQWLGNALLLTILWLCSAAFESSSWQATPGKKILGLRVGDGSGRRLTLWRAIARQAGKCLSAAVLGLGFLAIAIDRDRRAMHDRLAGTRVTRP
ncbi:RDD family protein [Paludibacterium paludis]|uniref:RDD domain-containing protein n=1 Tax=Paludibacterium paludis TaxID=1225769 RepID=A0A918P6V3_9NEIS|nr:RDD family protein [Paludibacterium paludis]GGY28321.1 hypothetical protein GCM10011289_34450 [Paludibacterium paludis]